ncbi:MAG: cupredoxin domain-containing protein [Deltaproteobacteria bacterium]|nr:cupredoxin domain-containing protein [Deltaproteobacteria bacterium]
MPGSLTRRALLVAAGLTTGCFDLGTEPFELPGSTPSTETSTRTPAMTDPTDPSVTPEQEDPCPEPHAPVEHVVLLILNGFVPDRVELCAGDTVKWQNRDSKEHTIFSGTPEAPSGFLRSPKIYQGESFSFTFETPGEYWYYCSVHKKVMRDGSVVVR